MKKYLNIITAGVLVTAMSGCHDFLDRSPYDSLSSETVWLSDEGAEMQINGIYKIERSVWNNQGYCYIFTCWGPDGYDYHRNSTIEMATASVSEERFRLIYTSRFATINAATEAIVNLDGNTYVSEDLGKKLMGEAYFFRGFSYFMLWQLFKEVPLVNRILEVGEELPKASEADVIAQIKSDFDKARDRLPLQNTGNDYGRITMGAAQAMLGRTLLYNEEWEDAGKELGKLMESPYQYRLIDEYAHLFDWKTEGWDVNKEFIYQLRFIPVIGQGTAYDSWYGNRSSFINGEDYCQGSHIPFDVSTYNDGTPIDLSSKPKRSSYPSEIAFGNDLIQWYADVINDPRGLDKRVQVNYILPSTLYFGKDNTYWKVNWPYEAHSGDTPNPALRTTFTNFACYSWRKFVCVGEEGYWPYQGPTDIPLIRYADVLLQYAEALNEHLAAPSQDVHDAVNKVRTRAGLDDLPAGLDKNEMRLAIRMERYHEFPGEGHLFFDVRRWRTAHTSDPIFGLNHDVFQFTGEKLFTRSFPERFYKWPIPQVALDRNSKLMQHEEWK